MGYRCFSSSILLRFMRKGNKHFGGEFWSVTQRCDSKPLERTEGKASVLLAALAFVINYDQGIIKSTELLGFGMRPKLIPHSSLNLRLDPTPLPSSTVRFSNTAKPKLEGPARCMILSLSSDIVCFGGYWWSKERTDFWVFSHQGHWCSCREDSKSDQRCQVQNACGWGDRGEHKRILPELPKWKSKGMSITNETALYYTS